MTNTRRKSPGRRTKAGTDPIAESTSTPGRNGSTKQEQGLLYLGIDLGTSRTSVAASNGVRESISSYVGYPKDVVSRKLLKQEVLYGDEAVARRLALNLFRPLAEGVIQGTDDNGKELTDNMRAARDLITEIIRRARPRSDELVYAVIGVPAQASIKNKEAILEAARESVDSVMLCSEPFSVAYGLDWLEDVLVVDLGAGTTDLCRMHGTMPEESDQITIPIAGDHVDRRLMELLEASCPGSQLTIQMVKAVKERYGTVAKHTEPMLVRFPVNGKPTEFDIGDDIRTACRLIIPPIVDAIGNLIASFDPDFQHKLKDRVLLAGGGSQINGLADEVESEMHERLGGGQVIRIEEPVFGGANGALKVAHDMPAEYWEQLK
ncbi:MAG: MamK family actin-like protein [Planctomycetota bacterium]|jgi:rod shape-determining protein MreB